MRITIADGRVYDFPDMCACCEMTTGGQHQGNCPLYQKQPYSIEPNRYSQIFKYIFKYDDKGNFIKEESFQPKSSP